MSHGNTMPPGEALAIAVAEMGVVDEFDSVHSHMNTDDDDVFVSTTIVWLDVDGVALRTATVLSGGSVV